MPRSIARLPIEVTPEKAIEIDRAVGQLQIITGQRHSRASFIREAIDREIARVAVEFQKKTEETAAHNRHR